MNWICKTSEYFRVHATSHFAVNFKINLRWRSKSYKLVQNTLFVCIYNVLCIHFWFCIHLSYTLYLVIVPVPGTNKLRTSYFVQLTFLFGNCSSACGNFFYLCVSLRRIISCIRRYESVRRKRMQCKEFCGFCFNFMMSVVKTKMNLFYLYHLAL